MRKVKESFWEVIEIYRYSYNTYYFRNVKFDTSVEIDYPIPDRIPL
jgi:hypothetical protein